jgi:hypothetical protein
MIRNLGVLAGIALLPALCAAAADKPNFSGEWTLNAAKSDFGPMPAPDKMIRKIVHKDPDLTITTTTATQAGERTNNSAYKTDGTESVNKSGQGESKSIVRWDGMNLIFNTRREIQGMSIEQNERWSLSEDGKTLSVDGNLKGPQGEVALKLVLDKK